MLDIFVTLCLLALSGVHSEANLCSNGQEWMECGSACNSTCAKPVVPCTLPCVQRCQCPHGTLQDIDIDGNIRCTVQDKCCPSGQVFDMCGSACPPTCNPPPGPIPCTANCVPGCVCPRDKPIAVKDEDDQFLQCISADQCCPVNMIWTDCGTACPPTCESINNPGPQICTLQCVIGCQCAPGFLTVFDADKNVIDCITEDECPSPGRAEPSDKCLDCMCGVQSGDGLSPGCGINKWWLGDAACGGSGCVTDRGQCRCGPYLITEAQFNDCSKTTDLPLNTWLTCASNNDCARKCLKEFMANNALACTGETDPKKVTCEDFARMLFGGADGCKKKKTKLFGRAVNRCSKS